MKALVLGGTRFIGLRLVNHLCSQGHDVTILNRGRTEAKLPTGVKRLYADRRDAEAVRKALSGKEFEIVYDITGYEVKNLEPMVELFAGKVAQYVFQSTCGVYDETRYLPILEDSPRISGETSKSGFAGYEANKVQCEDYLFKRYQETKFPITILRCPTIYGPENWMHEREFSYFVRLLQGRKILVPGRGKIARHCSYVDDVAAAHFAVAGNKKSLGQAFNIVHDEAVTIEGYIDTIAEVVGVKPQKVFVPTDALGKLEKPIFPFAYDRNYIYTTDKARQCFGFRPACSFEERMRQTYEWWQKNLGIAKTRFQPGKPGYDVDLAYEDKLIAQYG